MERIFNWGIMGPGFIANKVLPDFRYANHTNILAVASQTPGKAKMFAEKWKIERVYTDYKALVTDPDIDVIYVTTPNIFHLENVKMALEHGKHVLCEKPFTCNAAAAQKLYQCARKNNVFLMEAMWTRFMPAIRKMKNQVDNGIIGEIHQIVADFSYDVPYDTSYHLYAPELGGGTLLDGGIYPLSFAGYIYGQAPDKYTGYANLKNGVDVRDSVILHFPEGQMASFICGADTLSPWNAILYGTKGCIRIPSFYAAKEYEVEWYENGERKIYRYPYEGQGYQFEINEVNQCIEKGQIESSVMPLEESVKYTQIMDNLRKQWGVTYPTD